MPYQELLAALEEEAARQEAGIRADGEGEAARILAEARREAERVRAEALAAADAEAADRRRRAVAEAEAERDRDRLREQRRLLAEVAEEVLRRLAPRARELLPRLLDEALPAGAGEVRVVVDPGDEEEARALLARLRPELRAEVVAAPAPRGGVEVQAGDLTVDDTLPARLARAWPELEGRVAELLFGEES